MKSENSTKIAINSIELEIAGTKLKLTLAQAKELKEMLQKAFPEATVVYQPTHWIYSQQPSLQEFQPSDWRITCGSPVTHAGDFSLSN